MKYTIDASVMARWFLVGEEFEEQALKIRNDYAGGLIELYAPDLIIYEVLNSIWKAVVRKLMDRDDAMKCIEVLFKLLPEICRLDEHDMGRALSIAVREKLTVYDALYVVVAMKTNSSLVTADRELYEKAGRYVHTIYLKDYQ